MVCHAEDCYLQYTNFLNLSDKKSVKVSFDFPIHASGKQEEIKAAPVRSWNEDGCYGVMLLIV